MVIAMNREVQMIQKVTPSEDGAGVKLNRIFPAGKLDSVDPFILLDHFGSDNPADFMGGFPMHPHRGIETVTYMLAGKIKHCDSAGHSGVIAAGGVQWMSAGRGIMHEEMPELEKGKLEGLQLWVNLPAVDKMKKPEYQEYRANEITAFNYCGHEIRLISGSLFEQQGVVSNISTQPVYADITLNLGELELKLPEDHNVFIYIISGELEVVADSAIEKKIHTFELAVLTEGKQLVLQTKSRARILLASAKPINEPVVRSGPFVMNTRAEIIQAWDEIRSGKFPPE